MIAKLLCWFFGCKRGKRVPDDNLALECPRCGKRWTRKIRKAKA